MKVCEGEMGRVFIIRLEDGDRLPEAIEEFAAAEGVAAGHVILVGGIGGGNIVVGPRRSDEMPPDPMRLPIEGAYEVMGVGVLAPDSAGQPRVHLHAALGRSDQTLSGDIREGVSVWLVGEVIIYEIRNAAVTRVPDEKSGFALLEPGVKTERQFFTTDD